MFLLDWINPDEVLPLIVLICMLAFIGGQMTRSDSESHRRARRISVAVFLLYAGMGIYAWGPDGVTELLLIVLRASLAAGVSFGIALVTLTPAEYLIDQVKALIPKPRPKPADSPKPSPPTPIRDHAAEDRAEKERMNKIDDAKALANEFYQEHVGMLDESLPVALFKTQMHTRFPDDIAPSQAWQAAQEMIADMIPLIAKAREVERAGKDEQRKRDQQIKDDELKRTAAEEKGSAFQKLADWYRREQETVMQALPEGPDRDDALMQLFQRYDRLMKETYAEMKP